MHDLHHLRGRLYNDGQVGLVRWPWVVLGVQFQYFCVCEWLLWVLETAVNQIVIY